LFDSIYNTLRDIEAGAKRLAQIILGASHLPQTVVSSLLDSNNTQVHIWKLGLRSVLQEQARFICSTLVRVPGLQVLTPGGAMYTLLRLDIHSFDETISNDVTFSETLLKEENVFVLPGTCFGVPNMIRIVFCTPIPVLEQATERIQAFCKRHSKKIQ
jgi:tyrosine aminotransferase